MKATRPITPALSANAVHFLTFPAAARLGSFPPELRSSLERLLHRRARIGARQRSGYGNLSLTDTFGNSCDLRMINTARSIVETDVDGRTGLYRLKAVLRKHPDNCYLILDDKRHR